jgi:HK97 family phage portal protein
MDILGFFRRKKEKTPTVSTAAQALTAYRANSERAITRDSTTFACMDIIASAFAELSGKFFSLSDNRETRKHPLSSLLRNPNPDDTRFLFFYNSALDYFNGNCYWLKVFVDGEYPAALYRINPTRVTVKRGTDNRKIFSFGGKEYASDEVVHIPSRFGYNGLKGESVFDNCRSIFNNISELDAFVNNSFNNGVGDRLVIDANNAFKGFKSENKTLADEQIKKLAREFMEQYAGLENAGKPLIKHNGLDYATIQSGLRDNRSQQLFENRKLAQEEITRLFNVPLKILNGDLADVESAYTLFADKAIRPLAAGFEQAVNKFLLTDADKARVYFEYNYNSILRTSLMTRIDAYVKQINNGILSLNDVLRKENMPDIPAGDYHFVAANMMPVTEEVIQAYMASAKAKQAQLNKQGNIDKNIDNDAHGVGDDKK